MTSVSRNSADIAFFLPTLAGGGAERVTLNLAAGMSERGYRVDLVLVSAQGPYAAQVAKSVRVVDLNARRTLLCLPPLRRYVNEARPKVIVSALHHTNLTLLAAKKILGLRTRVVVTIHNTLSQQKLHTADPKKRLQHAIIGKASRWADKVVAISDDVADDFARTAGVERSHITTIYNPVITPELFRLADEGLDDPWLRAGRKPLIVGVGRLEEQKDFANLIRAFRLVADEQPSAHLLILGEGSQRPRLQSLARELRLESQVWLPGFVANPYAYLRRADTFVLSSKWEGLPTVLIEALALGVPVVATNCQSGPREILRDGLYGALVPVGDSSALAAAIANSLSSPRTAVDEQAWLPFTARASIDAYLAVAGVNGSAGVP